MVEQAGHVEGLNVISLAFDCFHWCSDKVESFKFIGIIYCFDWCSFKG